jgi:hypothetical protein
VRGQLIGGRNDGGRFHGGIVPVSRR